MQVRVDVVLPFFQCRIPSWHLEMLVLARVVWKSAPTLGNLGPELGNLRPKGRKLGAKFGNLGPKKEIPPRIRNCRARALVREGHDALFVFPCKSHSRSVADGVEVCFNSFILICHIRSLFGVAGSPKSLGPKLRTQVANATIFSRRGVGPPSDFMVQDFMLPSLGGFSMFRWRVVARRKSR